VRDAAEVVQCRTEPEPPGDDATPQSEEPSSKTGFAIRWAGSSAGWRAPASRELWVSVLTWQATQRADKYGVDRSTVVYVCRVAEEVRLTHLLHR
jgi:hypothetical protein